MPILAFTAGSLGDILSLLGLARRLSSSLANMSGQSGGLADILEDVGLLTRAINQVKTALDRRHVGMQPDVLLGIKYHLRICYRILLVVDGKVAAFNTKMTGKGGVTMETLRRYWAVASWEILGGREEVERLRARLRDQVDAIHTYLALAQSAGQNAIQIAAQSQYAAFEKILAVLQEPQRCFGRPATPSFQFTDRRTGLPYAPCAQTSIQHIVHLFGEEAVHDAIYKNGHFILCDNFPEKINSYPGESTEGLLRCRTDWGARFFDVHCYFYRGCFGCFQVLIGIAPFKAEYDTSTIQSLFRDLFMVGLYDATRHGTDETSYAAIRQRGDYVNGVVNVYTELVRECYVFFCCRSPLLFNELAELLNTFPDPASIETTVLPSVRQFRHEFYHAGKRHEVHEILGLIDSCARVSPETIAEYKLSKNVVAAVKPDRGVFIDCSDFTAQFVRVANRMPDIWQGL